MRKYIVVILLILLTACSLNLSGSPKEIVKEYLDKYKDQDSKVLSDFDFA